MKTLLTACVALVFSLTTHAQLTSKPEIIIPLPCEVQATPTAVRAMYVSKADDIINKTGPIAIGDVNDNVLLNWAKNNHFNHLILYGISGELNANPVLFTPKLAAFLKKAHDTFSITVSINVASESSATTVINFLSDPAVMADPLKRFDAIHYEAEYWNSSSGVSWATYSSELGNINAMCLANGVLCETYIGNPSHGTAVLDAQGQLEIDYINDQTHRIYVAYYTSSPYSPSGNIFQNKQYRYSFLQNSVHESHIVVLFNVNNSSPDPNIYAYIDGLSIDYDLRWRRPYSIWYNCDNGYLDDPDVMALTSNVSVQGYCYYRFQEMYRMSTERRIVLTKNATVEQPAVQCFPNPVKDELHFTFEDTDAQHQIMIVDATGKVVYSSIVVAGAANLTVNTAAFANGLYVAMVDGKRFKLMKN